jgi:hypothetical protein
MAGFNVNDDAIGQVTVRDDGLGAVRVRDVNAAGAQFKQKERRDDGAGANGSIACLDGRHVAPQWRSDAHSVSARPRLCREYLQQY